MTRPAPLGRVRRWHGAVAAIVLHTLVLFAVTQGVLALAFWAKDRRPPAQGIYDPLDDATLAKVYPHRSRADVMALWHETVRPLAHQSFTEFQETPRHGTFVNVDAAGFRWITDQHPWPPDSTRANVFVFGGSTTFGYGVADGDTIPSHLQPLLAARRPDVAVYNFGRGYYFSTQERILFEQLLAAGHVPAVAVFVDGLNDFCFEDDASAVAPRLRAAFTGESPSFADWLGGTPLGRAVTFAQGKLAPGDGGAGPSHELGDAQIRRVIARYRANKRLIEAQCAAYGITPIFVWQPVPMYRYDPRDHLFAERGFFGVTRVRHGYEAMAASIAGEPIAGDFLWLADVQEGFHEPLYVDIVHYTAAFQARLAAMIDARFGEQIARASAPAPR